MANEQEIGRLIIRLGADLEGLKKGFADGKREIQSFVNSGDQILSGLTGSLSAIKSHWMAISAAIGSALAAYKGIESAVNSVVDLGMQTDKLQRATGMTAEDASSLIAVADQMGVSFDTVSTAMTQITRRMGGLKGIEDLVVDSSGKTIDIFEKFNIQVKNQDGSLKSVTDVLGQMRKAIQGAGSETEQMTIATQFFRNNSQEMLKFLLLTDSEFRSIAEDAKRYGIVLTSETVGKVKELVMAHRDLSDAVQGAKITIGTELLPILTKLTKGITDTVAELRN
jgi:TP901 family phage tail tape measure protein